jgi:hypothetical protein
MPFRYVLKRAGVEHPVGYSLLLLAGGMIVCMLAAVTISIRASDKAIRDSERMQCESVAADIRAYREVPPSSDAGRAQLRSKENLFRLWDCPKPKEGE